MPNTIRKGQEEEEPERCEQKAEERVKEDLGEESKELKAERSNIDNEDMFESSQTNV